MLPSWGLTAARASIALSGQFRGLPSADLSGSLGVSVRGLGARPRRVMYLKRVFINKSANESLNGQRCASTLLNQSASASSNPTGVVILLRRSPGLSFLLATRYVSGAGVLANHLSLKS